MIKLKSGYEVMIESRKVTQWIPFYSKSGDTDGALECLVSDYFTASGCEDYAAMCEEFGTFPTTAAEMREGLTTFWSLQRNAVELKKLFRNSQLQEIWDKVTG